MKATTEFRREHAKILRQASALNGLSSARMTREAAARARQAMLALDGDLVSHLKREDQWLYPMLASSADAEVRQTAEQCIADLGGILGAWNAYRDRWDEPSILADPERFQSTSQGVIGALAIRVEMENTCLYPLMDARMASTTG